MTTDPKYPAKCYNKNCTDNDDSESGCTNRGVWVVDLCLGYNGPPIKNLKQSVRHYFYLPFSGVEQRYHEAVLKHGKRKVEKAKNLALITTNSFLDWVEVDECILDLNLKKLKA